MRVIGYSRVSSEMQRLSGASINAQAEKIRAQALLKEVEIQEIISDEGESGKSFDRPGMKRLLDMVRTGKVDMVIVTNLDRVSRSARDTDDLIKLFTKHDVTFISIAQSFDMSTATGRLMMGMTALYAQFEREANSERTSTALQQIKRSGCPAGPPPFGFSAQPRPMENGKRKRMPLIPNEAEQHTIRVILDMHSRGDSYRDMAAELNRAGYRTRKGGKWTFPAMGQIIKANTVVAQ